MQTFAPLHGITPGKPQTMQQVFRPGLEVLDYRRLGKQRIEVKQIILALERGSGGWANHPASLMWADHQIALLIYGVTCCQIWIERGYSDTTLIWMVARLEQHGVAAHRRAELPPWWGDATFHSRHRYKLLEKDPEFYSQYNWPETPDSGLDYIWPNRPHPNTSNGEWNNEQRAIWTRR